MKSLRFVSQLIVGSLLDPAIVRTIGMTLGCLLLATLLASVSNAQQRTFVSGLGFDTDPCTRTAPCRTFGQAISMTNAGGEVIVLDSAGYGPVVVTKTISLIAPPGVYAGISVFSGDGIAINAGPADVVVLRGLTVNDQDSNGNGRGIVFNSGFALHVESCVINGFSGTTGIGLAFLAAGHLEVIDSIFRGDDTGIEVLPATGQALATIDGTRLEGAPSGGSGVGSFSGSKVTVSNSVASGFHDAFGLGADTPNAEMTIESCVASDNTYGVVATTNGGVALARVSNSTITHNKFGLANAGPTAVILSRKNNTLEANMTNTVGTIGSYSAK